MAMLFLTRGELWHEAMWREWFRCAPSHTEHELRTRPLLRDVMTPHCWGAATAIRCHPQHMPAPNMFKHMCTYKANRKR